MRGMIPFCINLKCQQDTNDAQNEKREEEKRSRGKTRARAIAKAKGGNVRHL
jgi:hypothetical protein